MKPRRLPRRPVRRTHHACLELMEKRQLLATITVNTTADDDARDTTLSLREAIEVANGTLAVASLSPQERALVAGAVTSPAPNAIAFNIPGAGVRTITPATDLPTITNPVTIDGYTQPGSSPNTNPITQADNAVLRIELGAGNGSGQVINGLIITAGGSTVRGLVINSFHFGGFGTGIDLGINGGNRIVGNFLGTDATGRTAKPNTADILLRAGASDTTIGGTAAADRNLISSNSNAIVGLPSAGELSRLRIQGNFLGTDVTGTSLLGAGGIALGGAGTPGSGTIIGGTDTQARNVVLGGINLANQTGATVQGNFIGTDITGTIPLAGSRTGLSFRDARNNTIGGTTAGAGNVVFGALQFLRSPANLVQGNFLGTDASGTIDFKYAGPGIDVIQSSNDNVIGGTAPGAGNTIAFNGSSGVTVGGSGASDIVTGTSILGNSIYANGGPGIATAGGFPLPVLTSATSTNVAGTLDGMPNATYRLEFFATPRPFGGPSRQGKTFLIGRGATTDGGGHVNFSVALPNPVTGDQFITATATGPGGSTSEFSMGLLVENSTATTTTLISAPNPSIVGQSVTFTATVAPQPGGSPTGSISFLEGTRVLTTVPLAVDPVSGNGVATYSTATLPRGSHTITASYGGDARFAPSSGDTIQTVLPAAPTSTTTLTSAPNPSTFGQTVTFSALVRNGTDTAGTPTGGVTFQEGGTVLGTGTLDAAGTARFATASLAVGPHTITAIYGGDDSFLTSTSTPLTQTVLAPAGPIATTTSLAATPSPANSGQTVTLTARVGRATGSPGVPTGVVTFTEGATVLGTGTLDGTGLATFSTAALAPGNHTIAASYGGDARFAPSSSPPIVETIVAVPVDTEGPRVLGLRRFGFHFQPTVLVLAFDRPLNPADAQDVANYRIVGPRGLLVPVASAVYDPTARTVTLHPSGRLNLHWVYHLTVRGTPPGGVRGLNGNLLDGAGTGRAGSDYVTSVTASHLVLPGGRGFNPSLRHGVPARDVVQASPSLLPRGPHGRAAIRPRA